MTLNLSIPQGSLSCPPNTPISLVVPLALLFYWMEDNEASDVTLHFTASYAEPLEPLEPLTVGFELLAETRMERLEH